MDGEKQMRSFSPANGLSERLFGGHSYRNGIGLFGKGIASSRLPRMAAMAILLLFLTLAAAHAGTSSRQTNGCPPESRLAESEWVCFTLDEEADRQEAELDLESALGRLKLDLARAHAKKLRRFANVWSTVGVEYLPNAQTYEPYVLGGITVGRVDLWGGFFGDSPAIGLGWRF